MKANQERSKECLPPKKREIPSSTLPSDRHTPPTMAPPSDVPRSDSLPWLVGGSSEGMHRCATQSEHKPLPSSIDSSLSSSIRPASSLPALYTSAHNTSGGTVHYTQLPPNLQFIATPYTTTYPGYIPSQIFPPPPPPSHRPPHAERAPHTAHAERAPHTAHAERAPHTDRTSHTETSHTKPERSSSSRTSMPPPSTDSVAPHHMHQRTVSSTHHQAHHVPHSLHSQHVLGHGMSQVLVQYADGPTRKEEGGSRHRELHNGELERGRRFESKSGSKLRDSVYEARPRVLPSDYVSHDSSGLRISSMLLSNSHSDHSLPRASPDKHSSSHLERVSSKPVRTSMFTFPAPPPPSVENLKPPLSTASPQTVIQTTHSSTEPLSLGLPFSQQPIIGYIAGAPHCLPQHLLIPGPQPVIIPVSGAVTSLDAVTSQVTSASQAVPSPTKGDSPDASTGLFHQAAAGAVVQGQLHLPIVSASPGLVAPSGPSPLTTSNSPLPHALPPYFIKGSIIQLADGELKRVEDLKTEDFIQSAEISSELKIDSSTVERIEGSHTSPNLAVVQFAVGEHRAQVCVEVLVEYPFFVFGQGWSSCCPDRTTQLLELPCTKLSVGDVCISLTLKNVRNGSLKKPLELTTLPVKPSNNRSSRKENGVNQRGSSGNVENGEIPFEARPGPGSDSSRRPSQGRKRRWSAPEGRKVERSEEEPPVTLPKPNFIPHEVKVSIEGRSNMGK